MDYAMSQSSPFAPLHPAHSGNPHTVVHVRGSCICVLWILYFLYCTFFLFLKNFIIIRERGREGERGRNIDQCVIDIFMNWLPLLHPHWGPGRWPRHDLTRNWTGHLLVCMPVLSPLSHTSQGPMLYFTFLWLFCNYQLVFLHSFTFFDHPCDPLSSGNHQNILCIYDSVSVLLVF